MRIVGYVHVEYSPALTNMREKGLECGSTVGNAHDHPHHGIVGWLMVDRRDEREALKEQNQKFLQGEQE